MLTGSSGFDIFLWMVVFRHCQLPPLPRLLDRLCRSTLSCHRTDMVPSSCTPLCDSCCWSYHNDLLVCRIYRYGSDVASAKRVSLECMQLPPGSNSICGIWMVSLPCSLTGKDHECLWSICLTDGWLWFVWKIGYFWRSPPILPLSILCTTAVVEKSKHIRMRISGFDTFVQHMLYTFCFWSS